jgi:hypothetical protein
MVFNIDLKLYNLMQCCGEKLGGQFCNTCDHRHKRHRHRHNQILNQRLETYNVFEDESN